MNFKLLSIPSLALAACLPLSSVAGEVKNSQAGFLDFNFYPVLDDVDNDSVFTLNTFSKISDRVSYFSLINVYNQKGKNEFSDTVGYYTEQNLRWKISDDAPLDLTVQYNMRSGNDNDRLRLGVRWRLNNTSFLKDFFNSINTTYSINLHAVQIDNDHEDQIQLEHVFKMTFPYLTDDLYLAGFFDHTFNEAKSDNGRPSNPIIGEVQLGYRLFNNLYVISEYRLNQYRRSDVNNMGLGFQYKMKW